MAALTVVGAVVGLVTAFATVGFVEMVRYLNQILFVISDSRAQLEGMQLGLVTIAVLTLGGLAVGLIIRLVLIAERSDRSGRYDLRCTAARTSAFAGVGSQFNDRGHVVAGLRCVGRPVRTPRLSRHPGRPDRQSLAAGNARYAKYRNSLRGCGSDINRIQRAHRCIDLHPRSHSATLFTAHVCRGHRRQCLRLPGSQRRFQTSTSVPDEFRRKLQSG